MEVWNVLRGSGTCSDVVVDAFDSESKADTYIVSNKDNLYCAKGKYKSHLYKRLVGKFNSNLSIDKSTK